MARPQKAREGKPVKNSPAGFPLFADGRRKRIVTADPWAFLSQLAVTKLKKSKEAIALAYIQQGHEFFEAAQNPRLNSRPLLYYYSFLNVVKAALLIRGINLPAAAKHGISDPRANSRERLRLEGQTVHILGRARDNSEILPEFMIALGHSSHLPRTVRVLDLLRLIPSIHRTFITVEDCPPIFAPISKVLLLHADSEIWVRISLNSKDKDVVESLPALRKRRAFSRRLHQVVSQIDGETWFESEGIAARKRGFDTAITKLGKYMREIGIAPILTSQGYRFYFSNTAPSSFVPYLASVYGIAFYLGSVTRYKPDVFDKIISGKYGWVIAEFLATQPIQFLYSLASELAGTDVVRPYAAIS